jgi:tRNA A-37 threonylcarbamoyl transferase component Bud32
MTNCEKCGTGIDGEAAFCPECGEPVSTRPTVDTARTPSQTLSGLETAYYEPSSVTEGGTLAEGDIFHNRYTVIRQLGAGGMGMVYLANDRVTSKQVALKLIRPALVKSSTAVQRFIREGLTARDIRHPNVIAMHDVGDDNGQLYLVMEYLDGVTLRDWLHGKIQAGDEVPFKIASDIIRRMLDGLQAAHDVDVIHRDLKPENVMLLGDPADGNYRLVILDFGIARAIDSGDGVQLTSSGTATGTPLYMAPEQRTAADTVTAAADLYAVTAIFYELLMGVAPEGRLGSAEKERDDVPAGVDAVIDKGLSSRPRSRYQSAAELRGALESTADSGPVVDDKTEESKRDDDRRKGGVFGTGGGTTDIASLKNRFSRRTWIAVSIGALIAIALVALEDGEIVPDDNGGRGGNVIPPADVAGTWFAEVRGTGYAHSRVLLSQSGDSVRGEIHATNGTAAGSLSGIMEGNVLEYDYDVGGRTGSGVGQLLPDGIHMNVRVTPDIGSVEQHVLHKGHQPD